MILICALSVLATVVVCWAIIKAYLRIIYTIFGLHDTIIR